MNGFASYMPKEYWERRNILNSFPAPNSLAEMRRLGVDYVVVHPGEYAEDGVDGREVVRRRSENPPSNASPAQTRRRYCTDSRRRRNVWIPRSRPGTNPDNNPAKPLYVAL